MFIRKFDVIVALYIFGVMVAEMMGAKTFHVLDIGSMHLNASVAIFVMPLLFTVTDIITEVHGRQRARSVVWSGLITVFLLMLFGLFATHLTPSARFASSEVAYDSVFGASVRLAIASIAAFALSELLDVAVYSKLKQRMQGRALWLRNNVSNFVGQLADSTVFVVVAFYVTGMSFADNVPYLVGIIVPYWIVRCVLSVAETPLAYLGVRWLRGQKLTGKTQSLKLIKEVV